MIEIDIHSVRDAAALELDPDDPRFLATMGLLNDASGLVAQAAHYVRRARAEMAGDPAEIAPDDGARIEHIEHEPDATMHMEGEVGVRPQTQTIREQVR